MGLFDKFMKKEEQEGDGLRPVSNVMGFALFGKVVSDGKEIAKSIKAEFGDEVRISIKKDRLINVEVHLGKQEFLCVCMPFPVPDHEISEMLAYNMISPETSREMANHSSFLVIQGDISMSKSKRAAYLQFNRICGAVLAMEQAVGIYMGGAGLLIDKKTYFRHMDILNSPHGQKDSYFPSPLWIRVSFHMDGNEKLACTCGLRDFGFPEVCFYNTGQEDAALYHQLHMLAIEEITGRGIYKNMDLIKINDKLEAVCKLQDDVLYVIGG